MDSTSTLLTPDFFTESNLEIKWIDGNTYSIMKINLKNKSKKYDWYKIKKGVWKKYRELPYGIKIEKNTIIIDGSGKKKKFDGFDTTKEIENGDGSITIKGDGSTSIEFENISQYYTFMGWIKE